MYPQDIQHCDSQCALHEVYWSNMTTNLIINKWYLLILKKRNSYSSMCTAKVILTDTTSACSIHTGQHQERFHEFFRQTFHQRWKVRQLHITSPQQMFTTKEPIQSEDKPVLKNDPTMRIHSTADWDLSSVGRQKEKDEGGWEKKRSINSTGSPCSFRVTLHETTEQHGYIQFIEPNKLQVSPDLPKWEQTDFC